MTNQEVCNRIQNAIGVQHGEDAKHQGPVIQSIVSLTSSLRVISLIVLTDSVYNILIFFAEKNVSSFCTAKATHIFSAKNFSISLSVNFNKSLTNDVVSFEQLGPADLWLGAERWRRIVAASSLVHQ